MFRKSLITITVLISAQSFAKNTECQSVKEFSTTMNFLKSKKEFELDDKKIIEVSKSVAKGCNGAAGRFITNVNLLVDAEVPTKEAVSTSITLANSTDKISSNFSNIFKKVYVDKYFDLTTEKSLKIASDLTIKNEKDADKLMADFTVLGDFCMNSNGLDLNYDRCADFVHSVLMNSKDIDSTVGKQALEFFDFLVKDEKGPKMNVKNALKEIEKMSEYGANGFSNYTQGYVLATNPQGMNLGISPAMKFAEEMAIDSLKK